MTWGADVVDLAREALKRAEGRLSDALDAAGGRGVDLAEQLDRVRASLSALDGEGN